MILLAERIVFFLERMTLVSNHADVRLCRMELPVDLQTSKFAISNARTIVYKRKTNLRLLSVRLHVRALAIKFAHSCVITINSVRNVRMIVHFNYLLFHKHQFR